MPQKESLTLRMFALSVDKGCSNLFAFRCSLCFALQSFACTTIVFPEINVILLSPGLPILQRDGCSLFGPLAILFNCYFLVILLLNLFDLNTCCSLIAYDVVLKVYSHNILWC